MSKSLLLVFISPLFIASSSWALCVSVNQANLRAKPSSSSKLLWTVGKYMPLLALSQKGVWIQVRGLEGKKMWIHTDLVSDSIDCAVIKVSKSMLRKGPGASYSKTALSYAHRYMPFKKLERDGAWLHLQDDYGYRHWVFENNVWEPLAYTQLNY